MSLDSQPELGSLNSWNLLYNPWGAWGIGWGEGLFGA